MINEQAIRIPGFVDLQVNGYKGIDFSSPDLTEEDFIYACKELICNGTIAFLPTIITSSAEVFERNLKLMASLIASEDFKKHIIGFHVEGPFISDKDGARGAHSLNWVKKPDISLLDDMIIWSEGNIKLLTIAAELEGSEELCRHAVNNGITVSLGHQLATEADLDKLVSAGAKSLTHLGNGLPKLLDRHRNPLLAGLANDQLVAMMIADGHHVPVSLLKTIIRVKGVANLIVVSDASPIAGLPPGRYNTLGNDVILEESGLLYNPATGYLVGSSSTMMDCMNYLITLNYLNDQELIDVGFNNPLRLINEDPSNYLNFQSTLTKKGGSFEFN